MPVGAAGNDVRTLAQSILGKIASSRPAVVAIAAAAGDKASLVVTVNGAGRDRGLSASELVKGALSGRGGGNSELAQGGGLPAADAPGLVLAIEKIVAAR